jgi:hypothetical protein
MAEDYHAWLRKKEEEQVAKRVAAATPPKTEGGGWGAYATPGGIAGVGSESIFANTPAGPEDKGLLTKFGSRQLGVKTLDEGGIGEISSEGGTKTITVGEPIKTETLMKPLSKSESI